jgi:hypothetical protein
MRSARYAALAASAAGLLLAACTTTTPSHSGATTTPSHASAVQPATTTPVQPRAVQPAAAVPLAADGNYHCVNLPRHHAHSCIVTKGFLYWGDWAFVNALYWHPNTPDIVVTDVYFKAAAPGRQHGMPQEYNRTIVLADNVIVVNWDVTANTVNPPAPTKCMIDQGPQAGTIRACTPIEQRSVLDWWNKYTEQFPGWDW